MTSRQQMAIIVGSVGTALIFLSVWHLTVGINTLTQTPVFLSLLLAIGIDLGLVVTEFAELVARDDEAVGRWSRRYMVAATVLSAIINSYEFYSRAPGGLRPSFGRDVRHFGALLLFHIRQGRRVSLERTMSAIIVTPSKRNWKIIRAFLGECEEGAIVVPPEYQAKLKEACKGTVASYIPEYDFNSPDYVIDVARLDIAATHAWDMIVEESKDFK